MKRYIKLLFVLTFLFCTNNNLFAQNHEAQSHEVFKHHRISLIIGHTHVPKGFQSEEKSKAIIIPSWGLNYEYWFNEKWALALHNDMEVSTYVVEDKNGSDLERERPFIIALVGLYNTGKGPQFLAGFGKEFESHHDFWVYRLGIEYEIELRNHWDIAPSFIVDFKEDLYDSWTLGLGIGKRF